MRWYIIGSFLLATLYIPVTLSSSAADSGLERYETMLMRDLYKRLSDLDIPLDIGDVTNSDLTSQDGGYNREPELSAAALRDAELIEHSSAGNFFDVPNDDDEGEDGDGRQHGGLESTIDGMTGGKVKPIKVDTSLPFYCYPPNPCPKGFTSEDGCDTDIKDTAEAQKAYINEQQIKNLCTCDREHMYNCPEVAEAVNIDSKQAFDKAVNSILSDRAEPIYLTGEKRRTLVAKKSPRFKRNVHHHTGVKSHHANDPQESHVHAGPSASAASGHHKKSSPSIHGGNKKSNPYLQGEKLRTVAKKG